MESEPDDLQEGGLYLTADRLSRTASQCELSVDVINYCADELSGGRVGK